MRSPRLAAAALTVLALTALGACGDGDDDAKADPTTTASSEQRQPTAAEYAEAHELYHGLATTLDDANKHAGDFQTAVRTAAERDPKGFRESVAVAEAVETQDAAVAAREAALDELAEHPAMADDELATAYQAFADKYDVATAYQDGFNDSFPAYLVTNTACTAVLDAPQPQAWALDPAKWSKEWLAIEGRYAPACLTGAAELDASTNEDMAALGGLYEKWLTDRADLGARLGAGGLTPQQFPAQLKKVNDAFTTAYGKTAEFSEKLGTLYPTKEYAAIDAVFKDRVGESGSPAASPSASAS